MRRPSLPRRLLASAAGLAIGLGGALALAAPAQAVDIPVGETDSFPVCDGTYLNIASTGGDLVWSVTAGGEVYWPDGEDGTVESGQTKIVFVPKSAGDIEVDYEGSDDDNWPKIVTYTEPDWCADLPEPTFTQPTCDSPGEIVIPALPELFQVTDVQTEQLARVANQRLFYELNGDEVEPESTHTVAPGTHVVTLNYEVSFPISDQTIEQKFVLKTWIIEIEAPECDLPDTGTQVALIAGGALLLLTFGSAAYFLARRRRISFTA